MDAGRQHSAAASVPRSSWRSILGVLACLAAHGLGRGRCAHVARQDAELRAEQVVLRRLREPLPERDTACPPEDPRRSLRSSPLTHLGDFVEIVGKIAKFPEISAMPTPDRKQQTGRGLELAAAPAQALEARALRQRARALRGRGLRRLLRLLRGLALDVPPRRAGSV